MIYDIVLDAIAALFAAGSTYDLTEAEMTYGATKIRAMYDMCSEFGY